MLQDILRLLMGAHNPGLLPQGQDGAAPGLPVPPGATPPPPAAPLNNQNLPTDPSAAGPDIVIGGQPIDPAKVRSGILGGTFGVGRTGGNILGLLGDAFLTQAGRDPQYAPRLQQAREAEALQNYQSDPTGALDKFLAVNPEKALGAINTNQDNQRADKATNAILRDKDQGYEDAIRSRASSMLYSANEKTWPAVRAQALAYAKSKGIELDIPETWEGAQQWAQSDVPVKDRMSNDATAAYRAATLDQRARDSAAREAYYKSNVAERRGYHEGVIANNRPSAKPPTPTTVLGSVQAKVQKSGLASLSPGERQIYDDSFKGKTGSKGSTTGPRIVRDPVTGAVSFAK